MKLLKITEDEYPRLESLFEETEKVSIEKVSPEVIDGSTNVVVGGEPVEKYDAAFLQVPEKNPVFGRVLLETINEKGVKTNYPAVGFFIMAKKNYLHYTLNQRDVQSPNSLVVASKKAARNIDKELEFPIIGRKYEDMLLTESKNLENTDQVKEFAEGIEYGEDLIVFQQYSKGEKYRVMYVNDQIISLRDKTEGWRVRDENLHYSSLGQELKDRVKRTMKSIGTPYGEVILQDGRVIDVEPNPDPELYTDVSGKNAFESIADILKEQE